MNLTTGHLSKRASFLISRLQLSNNNRMSSTSTPEIRIPMKKERGPTDILQALESTIKHDPTAPRYKYHDDPYLIPISNSQKRIYSLAQESGRKAAMWIKEQHSNLFEHKVADPVIESFLPKAVYDDETEVSEEILKKVIRDAQVTDALTIYKLLNKDVSPETKCELLQLLCFYNNEEPLSDKLVDERWLKLQDKRLSWKNTPEINELFTFLKDQDKSIAADAYTAMICGLAKFRNELDVWELYEEAKKKHLPLSVDIFNALLSTVPRRQEDSISRYNLVIQLLQMMKKYKVQPDIGTLNSALRSASLITNSRMSQRLCYELFAEFMHIGIEPSLGSYNYALYVFYRKDSLRNSALNEIITRLENKSITIQDRHDFSFFMNAMEIASTFLEDAQLADRIHKLLLYADNYNFLGDNMKENIYYRHYLILQVRNQALDDFVTNYYDLIVPHVYTPDHHVMDAILNAFEANDPEVCKVLLPKFWTHIVQFSLLDKKNLPDKSLRLMRGVCQPDKDSPINKIYADAAWTIWNHSINISRRQIGSVNWNAAVLCNMAILFYRADEINKCASIIAYLFEKQHQIINIPEESQIEELFNLFMADCHVEPIVNLVHYCADIGHNKTSSLVVQAVNNLSLSEQQKNRLENFVNLKNVPIAE